MNLKKMALVVVATGGLLFAGAGVSAANTAAPQGETAAAPQSETAAAPQAENAAPQSDAPKGGHKGKDDEGDNNVLSNFNEMDWDDSPVCGTQIETKETAQKVSCSVTHITDSIVIVKK